MKIANAAKSAKSAIDSSLSFLDITWVRMLLFAIIIIYILGGLPFMSHAVSQIFHTTVVKLLFLVLIIYISFKDIPLALLLALAFVLSLQMGYRYQLGAQLGASSTGLSAGAHAGIGDKQLAIKASLGNVNENMFGGGSPDPKGGNFNKYSDCVAECKEDGSLGSGSLDSPCRGVGVWPDELNAQGFNCPIGYSGGKDGAPFKDQ